MDPSFRQHFEIGGASKRHRAFLDLHVPEVFVGTLVVLRSLVESAAAEIAQSFKDRGLVLPPWRTTHSLAARWFSDKFKKVGCSDQARRTEVEEATLRAKWMPYVEPPPPPPRGAKLPPCGEESPPCRVQLPPASAPLQTPVPVLGWPLLAGGQPGEGGSKYG